MTPEIDVHLKAFEKSDVFTPEEIAKRMVSYLSGSGTVLDPAVGTGNLIKQLPETYAKIEVYDIKQTVFGQMPTKGKHDKTQRGFYQRTEHQ